MNDLNIIKKKYGEKMMHLCRSLFPILLEQPGILSKVMLEHFEPSRTLYYDVVNEFMEDDFKDYIYSFIDVEKQENIEIKKTPAQLLDEAGYILYECKSEKDIQSFKKYYAPDEELCTFNGERLNRCYVFWAVKKNVNDIKRENFPNPKRQDEYGTSVISIQFAKGNINTLSIKNRYNHKVNNPDATFSNNLDNIIPGLTESFAREYSLKFNNESVDFELPNYVKANDGKFYKYNYEINNIYYCPNNVIIDNFKVIDKYKKEPERYIVLDYFIIDLSNKTIELYDKHIGDSFCDGIQNIEKCTIIKSKETGNRIIEVNCKDKIPIKIEIDNSNIIVGYQNENLIEVGDMFLEYNEKLKKLQLPNLLQIGFMFLGKNTELSNLKMPKLIQVSNYFLHSNRKLIHFEAPNLIKTGHYFLTNNRGLTNLSFPKLAMVGSSFLKNNMILANLYLPNLRQTSNHFLAENRNLRILQLPNLETTGGSFLQHNKKLEILEVPKLKNFGSSFLRDNEKFSSLYNQTVKRSR